MFRLDPELAHAATVECCRWTGRLAPLRWLASQMFEDASNECLRSELAGLPLANPIGLAAGWDKSGRALGMLGHLGFGFAEIGSISARPSIGNPKPRLFRLPDQRAIVVNYGLPNDGAGMVARRLAARQRRIPIGANIVKTNDGPGAAAAGDDEILDDYCHSVAMLAPWADYLTLNLSCPNASGGKDFFAAAGNIGRLLERLATLSIACPVFLKLAPNDDLEELRRILAEVEPFDFVRGFLFNLSPGKPPALQWTGPIGDLGAMPGAVSGAPVGPLIDRCIARLASLINRRRYVIIGVGGIFNAEDAYRKIRLGASALQLYTALVYEGPGVVRQINRSLVELLHRDGFSHVSQAVGIDAGSGRV